ncbi:MAG: GAF domain-containing protein [Exilispira sp.]
MVKSGYLLKVFNLLSYNCESEQYFCHHIIDELLDLVKSKYCVVFYNENKDQFELDFNDNYLESLAYKNDDTLFYRIEKDNLLRLVVVQKKELIINDLNELKLKRIFIMPVVENEKIISIVAVAGKEDDYDEIDISNLEIFMKIILKEYERRKIEKSLINEK